jgi:MFS transporter, DHA3 family, multidrug efflux protein
LSVLVIAHLLTISVPEKEIVHIREEGKSKVDLKGTLLAIGAVPGLFALIFFTTFNNFLGGVFMALMDAYGLSLVSVQVWGIIWGVLSTAFILGGIIIAKWGLGKNPLKTLLLANLVIWSISSVFTLYGSIVPLVIGMFIYLAVVPYIEAAEHTVVQKVVPLERQGRVFGFAQSVEQAASPMTAFLISPLAQFVFIPFMSVGGLGAEIIGEWFGTGQARGIALVFTTTGVIGLIATFLAFRSRPYKLLSKRYQEAPAELEKVPAQ